MYRLPHFSFNWYLKSSRKHGRRPRSSTVRLPDFGHVNFFGHISLPVSKRFLGLFFFLLLRMKNCQYLNSYYHSLADGKQSLLYSQFTNFVRKWSTLVTPDKWMGFSRLLSFVPVANSFILGVEVNCRQIEKRGFRWVPLRVRRQNWETTSACKKRRKSKGFVWLRYQADSGHIDMHNSFIIFPPYQVLCNRTIATHHRISSHCFSWSIFTVYMFEGFAVSSSWCGGDFLPSTCCY